MFNDGCHNCIHLRRHKEMHGFEYGPPEIYYECTNETVAVLKWKDDYGRNNDWVWVDDNNCCPGYKGCSDWDCGIAYEN